jgi:hypothetical protein
MSVGMREAQVQELYVLLCIVPLSIMCILQL